MQGSGFKRPAARWIEEGKCFIPAPPFRAVKEAFMWMHPSIRDLLDTMAAAAPDSTDALARTRAETLQLLVALFGPTEGEPGPELRQMIARALDAMMAERMARGPRVTALQPA
jgi:hypothetical protein